MVTPTLIWPDFTREEVAAIGRRARRRFRRAVEESHDACSALELAALAVGVSTLPAAALTRLAHGAKPVRDEYLAEPVMLRPDRDRLSLRRLGDDAPDAEETRALVQAAHAHFPEDELRIAPGADVWHVRLPGVEPRTGLPVERAQEALLNPLPEEFGVDVRGMRVLNELQMLWYSHPVNEARRSQGRAEVNALWIWGGGDLPRDVPGAGGLKAIVASQAEFAGLANWLDLPLERPETALERADFAGCLVVIGSGEAALGRRWLTRLCGRRGGFRLLAGASAWNVPVRGFPWRW